MSHTDPSTRSTGAATVEPDGARPVGAQLADLLVEAGLLSPEHLTLATRIHGKVKGSKTLTTVILELKHVTEDRILDEAIASRVSDIHFAPGRDGLRIRFRQDGVMVPHADVPPDQAVGLVGRIKVLAGADIAERRRHQDGRIHYDRHAARHGGHPRLDLRDDPRREDRHAAAQQPRDAAGDQGHRHGAADARAPATRRARRPERHRDRDRADRVGQDHDALRRRQLPERRQHQHHHRRGSGRVHDRRHLAVLDQPEDQPRVRRDPEGHRPPGPRRDRHRRDPRPVLGRDRHQRRAHRSQGAHDVPHRGLDRRAGAPAQHEHRGVPHLLDGGERGRAAAGAPRLSEVRRGPRADAARAEPPGLRADRGDRPDVPPRPRLRDLPPRRLQGAGRRVRDPRAERAGPRRRAVPPLRLRDPPAARKITLPVFSNVAIKVQKATRDERYDIAEIERAIESDPALVAEVLKAANSAFFGGLAEVATIRAAVLRLGLPRVANLVFLASEKSRYTVKARSLASIMTSLWHHASACAMAAEWIARKVRYPQLGETVFIGALVHDIGKLFLRRVLDEMAAVQAEKEAVSEELVLEVLTRANADVGHRLLAAWHLPEVYQTIVRDHHLEAPDPSQVALQIVRLANFACAKVGASLHPDPSIVLGAMPEATILGLSEIALAELEILLEDVVAKQIGEALAA